MNWAIWINKVFRCYLDENLTWKEHIKYLENEVGKNIGILFRSKPYLNKKSLLSLYYSFIHSYISYANIAWERTYLSYMKKKSIANKTFIASIIKGNINPSHCVKRARIRSYSGPHFSRIFPHSDWIRRDTVYVSVFSPNAGKCGKMWTRITPNTDTFYAVSERRNFNLLSSYLLSN